MEKFLTVDSGTSNTRISLVVGERIADTLSFPIGARANMEGERPLFAALKQGIEEILSRNNLQGCDIKRILAAGMITSEYGVCSLDHIIAPAGIRELHNSLYEAVIEEISDIPFVFVRGVRTEADTLENADMMRGEETELFGISSGEEGVYVLPGSHSKIIVTDKEGRIKTFKTMLTGEMISVLSQNTILKGSFDLKSAELVSEYLFKGYEYADKNGINEALFKVRVLKNTFGRSESELYSFFMGALLSDEIKYIASVGAERVTVGGRAQIRRALSLLLSEYTDAKIITLDDDTVNGSLSLGMVSIYEYNE